MESPLVWRCSYPKKPSSTWTPAHHLSMMSSSTRLPTTEAPPLSAKPRPLSHPPLMSSPNHPSPQNKPWKVYVLTVNQSPWGAPHQVNTRRPAVTQHLGVIPPPTLPPSTNVPPTPLSPLSCAEIWLQAQSTLRVGETTRVDESAQPLHRLTSLGHLHHHHPGWRTVQSAPGHCHPDRTVPSVHPNHQRLSLSNQWFVHCGSNFLLYVDL